MQKRQRRVPMDKKMKAFKGCFFTRKPEIETYFSISFSKERCKWVWFMNLEHTTLTLRLFEHLRFEDRNLFYWQNLAYKILRKCIVDLTQLNYSTAWQQKLWINLLEKNTERRNIIFWLHFSEYKFWDHACNHVGNFEQEKFKRTNIIRENTWRN